jgi:hypothetical protein
MWIIPEKRQCYGNLFPDLSRIEPNTTNSGVVFGCRLSSLGSGAQPAAEIFVDDKMWERCTECSHFRSCFDLSMAKLAFTHAIAGRN